MIKRKQLGQHFLNSNSIAKSIVSEAKITKNDVVFEHDPFQRRVDGEGRRKCLDA